MPTNGIAEGCENGLRDRVFLESPLGMPLHAQQKAFRTGQAHGFDHAVIGARFHEQAGGKSVDALAVQRIHARVVREAELGEDPAVAHDDGMGGRIFVVEGKPISRFVAVEARHLFEVLVECAAQRHVQFLKATADAEHRHACRDGCAQQRNRGGVAGRIQHRAGAGFFAAVKTGRDIAEAIALEGENARREEMERLAAEPRGARARLFDFFFRELRMTYRKLEEDPRTAEITRLVARERPTFSESILAAERALIARILYDGHSTGEFFIEKPKHTAEMIQSATLKFRFPQLWSAEPLSQLEWELEGVLGLIIEGIAVQPRASA